MAFTPSITYVDLPNTSTPLSASNINASLANAAAYADTVRTAQKATVSVSVEDYWDGVGWFTSIQAAVAAVKARGGGTIKFLAKTYSVDTSSGILVSVDETAPVILEGEQAGNVSANVAGTRINRTAGTNELVKFLGTGTSGEQRAHGGLRNIELNGGGTSGTVCHLERCNELEIDRVRFGNATGSGLICRQVWNTSFGKITVWDAGSGTATPALLIDGIASESSSDTCVFESPQFELNTGTDVKISGHSASAHPAFKCKFISPKIERGGQGQASGLAMTWPAFDIDYADDLEVTGFSGHFYTPTSGSNTSKFVTFGTGSANTLGSVRFTSTELTSDGSPTEYIVIQGRNRVIFDGLYCQGTPTNKYVKIDSAITATSVRLRNFIPATQSLAVDDQRTTMDQLRGVCHVPGSYTSGATLAEDATSTLPSWAMNDSATGVISGSFQIPGDAATSRPLLIKVVWSAGVTTGNVRFRFRHDSLSPGDAMTTATFEETLQTVTTGGTANAANVTTYTGTKLFSPYDMVSVRVAREGSSGLDTLVGDIRVYSIDVMYERQL